MRSTDSIVIRNHMIRLKEKHNCTLEEIQKRYRFFGKHKHILEQMIQEEKRHQ